MSCRHWIAFFFLLIGLPAFAQDAPQHSVFIAGPTFTGILDEDGKEVWNAGRAGARDGCVLENGNVLICWSDEVRELTRDKKETVFHYKLSKENQELGTAQRLEDSYRTPHSRGRAPLGKSDLIDAKPQASPRQWFTAIRCIQTLNRAVQ